jgi:serine protease inhibitor
MRLLILLTVIYFSLSHANPNISTSFPTNIFKSLNTENKNVLISPLSLQLALSLATNGATGSTQTQMLQVISPENPSLSYINDVSYLLTKTSFFSPLRKAKVNIANGIFTYITPLSTFIGLAKDKYHATVQKLESAEQVNTWTAKKTSHKITHIIDEITSETKLILISAVYFQSRWLDEFGEDATTEFRNSNGETVKKPYIENTLYSTKYYQAEGTRAISIELVGNYVFDVIMPENLGNFISSLNKDTLSSVFKNMEEKNVHIHLPVFSFEYSNELSGVLQHLGMKQAFTGDADFSGLSSEERLSLNEVVHKTFIKVTKYGVEAAAATAMPLLQAAMAPPDGLIDMVVDRPFLFTIRAKNKDTLLFLGKVENL